MLIGRIRIWDLSHALIQNPSLPLILPAKAVSCLDYHASEGIIVVGTHDVGRVQVWAKDTEGKWSLTHILSGHLHGIRAVA